MKEVFVFKRPDLSRRRLQIPREYLCLASGGQLQSPLWASLRLCNIIWNVVYNSTDTETEDKSESKCLSLISNQAVIRLTASLMICTT